jgi:TRAP-type C4-dicarboxylate transport system permease small subunit
MASRGLAPVAEAAIGCALMAFARWLAVAGGILFVGLAIMTVTSVLGRAFIWIGLDQIEGDFEIVEMGCAIAIFCFLPWCQINRGNVTVDVFIEYLPIRGQIALSILGNVAMAFAAVVIAQRMWLGFVEKLGNGQETWILGMHVWWGYAASMVGAALFAIIALYSVWRSLNEMIIGEEPV